jgi:hypothetical protein
LSWSNKIKVRARIVSISTKQYYHTKDVKHGVYWAYIWITRV